MKWILAKTEWDALVAVPPEKINCIYVQDHPYGGTPNGVGYLIKVEVPMLDDPLKGDKAKMTTRVLDVVEIKNAENILFMMFDTEEEANASLLALVEKLNAD